MDVKSVIRRSGILLSIVVVVLLSGCNKGIKQDLALAQQEAAELRQQNEALSAQLNEKNSRIAELEGRLSQISAAPPAFNNSTRSPRAESYSTDRSGNTRLTIAGDVLFDSGQATLKQSAKTKLNQIAAQIQRDYPGASVRVEGYTDTDPIRKSKWSSNEELSQARAEAVRDYLAARGINATAVGMGSANPKATKAASRRVEIVILR
jgi:flagellar motor protein MotB